MTRSLSRRFNKKCSFIECESWMREGDIFCYPHYHSLPRELQLRLWSKDPRTLSLAIREAKQWLQDKMDNALIVQEEGP